MDKKKYQSYVQRTQIKLVNWRFHVQQTRNLFSSKALGLFSSAFISSVKRPGSWFKIEDKHTVHVLFRAQIIDGGIRNAFLCKWRKVPSNCHSAIDTTAFMASGLFCPNTNIVVFHVADHKRQAHSAKHTLYNAQRAKLLSLSTPQPKNSFHHRVRSHDGWDASHHCGATMLNDYNRPMEILLQKLLKSNLIL